MNYLFLILQSFCITTFAIKQESSYNSFIGQVGFCKLQSFNTISRSTSDSIPMFLDGRISFGVGLSDFNMQQSNSFLCGACINVTRIENFYEWNQELTEWQGSWPQCKSFTVMVMDQCTDPVCIQDYLDFDIYNALQPVANGNPYSVQWNFIPCPVLANETIDYLLCTATTCHLQDPVEQTVAQVIGDDVYYWALTIRNTRIPISIVLLHLNNGTTIELELENAWIWDHGSFDLKEGLNITIVDAENKMLHDFIQLPSLDQNTSNGYHGGIIISSKLQN
jgi:hypothetical protein